jgi:Transposase DDE domain group 1
VALLVLMISPSPSTPLENETQSRSQQLQPSSIKVASSRCSQTQTASGSTLRRLNFARRSRPALPTRSPRRVYFGRRLKSRLVAKRGVFVTAGNSPLGSEWTFREVCSGNSLKSLDAGINSATANQVRLVLHTAAFWLTHAVRAAIPQTDPLAKAEFTTIRERLIKIGARVIEHIARIRVQLPTSCPEERCLEPSRSACCYPVHELRGRVPRRAADRGKSTPDVLRSELPHTDPAGRIAGGRPLARCAKTRHVMHDYG